MNKKHCKMNERHKCFVNLSQRSDLRTLSKHFAFRNLSIYYTWKNIRKQYKNNELKIIAPTMVLFQIFKIMLNISLKNMKH